RLDCLGPHRAARRLPARQGHAGPAGPGPAGPARAVGASAGHRAVEMALRMLAQPTLSIACPRANRPAQARACLDGARGWPLLCCAPGCMQDNATEMVLWVHGCGGYR